MLKDFQPHAFENLGGKERVKDTRDHLIGAVGTYDFPPVLMSQAAFDAPVYFQGHRPACGAHAGTWLKVFINGPGKDTPRYLWINIKRDGTSPSDGTDMASIFKSLQTYGSDTFEPLENNVMIDDVNYANPAVVSADMLTTGKSNTISSYAFPSDYSFSGIKQTIKDFGHALLLIRLSARFWTAADGRITWGEESVLPLAAPSEEWPVVSAHFVVAHSYDEKYIYFANSFGELWGRKGHGYFGEEYIPWVVESGVAHNAPVASPVAIQTVQNALPQVQNAINHLAALPPEARGPGILLISKLLALLVSMLKGG